MGCNIELESITNAIKTRELLRKNKINAKIEKSTGRNKQGCAYSVMTNADCKRTEKIVTDAGIKIIGIS